MTALLILESHSLDEYMSIPYNATKVIGSKLRIKMYTKIDINNAMHALLIKSSNDIAIALAEFNSGDEKSFVEEMNKKAKELNMLNTKFTNPHGLDEKDNHSTANDLMKLISHIWKNDDFRSIVSKKRYDVESVSGYKWSIYNTNKILSQDDVLGGKTGTTDIAKQCIFISMDNGDSDVFLLVLGSDDRYNDIKSIMASLQNNVSWERN